MARPTGLSFNKLIPNIMTLGALCAGMTAIRFGFQERWQPAATAIIIAAVLDALDGRVARLLQGTSKFGAELDSLSDFVCFGVAPALVLYTWTMRTAGGLGWALVLLYAVCCGLRLARFNTMIGEADLPPWAYNFFTGVPAPAGAGIVMLPMLLSFEFGRGLLDRPAVSAVFLVGTALLFVSRIPTFSFKKVKIPHPYVLPFMLAVGLFAAFLVSSPWGTFSVVILVYLATIPLSVRRFSMLKKEAVRLQETPESGAAPT